MSSFNRGNIQLNSAQAEVATSVEKRIVVLAGAGTGKTAAIVHKVAHLVREGVERRQIMMITFTRKAASEMQKRVTALISDIPPCGCDDTILIGTYHAIASILLRRDARGFGLNGPNFTTLDEDDALSLMKSAFRECDIKAIDRVTPARVRSALSFAVNKRLALLEHYRYEFGDNFQTALQATKTYRRLKKAANALDYDDLLTVFNDRLAADPGFASSLRARYQHVICDEFQDNNALNYEILTHLNPNTLTVVGDVNQSIYGFRGASCELVDRFLVENPAARVIRLESNYRSGQKILDLANLVVENTARPLLLTSARNHWSDTQLLPYSSPVSEAGAILENIRRYIADGVMPCEIAVLARSSRSLSNLEMNLKFQKIPYKKYGGLALGDAAEVKDFIAYLRLAFNPDDRVALVRCLTQFPGVGDATAEHYASSAEESGDDLFAIERTMPKGAASVNPWLSRIRALPSLGEKGRFLLAQIKPLIERNYPQNASDRLETLRGLVDSMKGIHVSMAEFLDAFSLEKSPASQHKDCELFIATIHASKGLEFDTVFVCGAGNTQMPHPRALDPANHEEELRLMYVAVTRAKRHLLLTYPVEGLPSSPQVPSPFLPSSFDWDNLNLSEMATIR